MSQINIFDEIIADNFAGGGGASTGIELAAGRPVTIAINHDPDAILLHKTNHPYTTHMQASVWDVDPVEVCRGRPVGLAWFSPDCKHFSKAKGAALVDRKIRGLAWIVLRWAGTVRPRVIMLENVEEFQTWGPVRRGKPVKKKAGQTFRKFITQLSDLGYDIEYRELVAADYGAPTTRKRFVLVARCDGKPIKWPEPTHAHRESEEVKNGKLKPWRSAAEIIDWSIPGYSIFQSAKEIKEKYGAEVRRPLKPNTMRRAIRGVDKFSIKSGNPFLIECNHGGDSHIRSIDDPVNTITGKYTGGICQPIIAPFTFGNTSGSIGAAASDPVHTVTTAGNQVLGTPVMAPFTFSNTGGSVGSSAADPVHTIRTAGGQVLAAASLMAIAQTGGGDRIRDVRDPVHTVVQPQWCELIASGEKTLEVRKTRPKLETPFKVYIYCTKGYLSYKTPNGMICHNNGGMSVIGEFICDDIRQFDVPYPAFQSKLDPAILEASCCTYYALHRYAYHDVLFGWHISDLKIYDFPKRLSKFTGLRKTKFGYEPVRLTRPPQSWCYVEEQNNGN